MLKPNEKTIIFSRHVRLNSNPWHRSKQPQGVLSATAAGADGGVESDATGMDGEDLREETWDSFRVMKLYKLLLKLLGIMNIKYQCHHGANSINGNSNNQYIVISGLMKMNINIVTVVITPNYGCW